jgi:nucleoside-diphosphate-sugar epimerase
MFGETMDLSANGLAVGRFVQATINGDALTIQGTGRQRRDFLHVSDAVSTVCTMLDQSAAAGVYNLGSGTSTSIQEIADCLSDRQIYLDSRPGSEYNTRANIQKVSKIGHTVTVSILDWLTQQKSNKFKEFLCR